ncbi:MAG: VanZ family protein [Deltaproteobacteria bacterium]|nr:VanZ family protein [Deltaproteobacteria bacterium]
MPALPSIPRFNSSKRGADFRLAAGFTALIFFSLYFTPFLRDFLSRHLLLGKFVSGFYVLFGLGLILLFLHKYQIRNPKAYLGFLVVFVLFLLELQITPMPVERLHFIEYALLFAVWFRVLRHFFKGIGLYGAALWWVCLIGLLDEGIQKILPNRHFDWDDIYLNVFGSLLGLASVWILMRYRRDRR